MRSLLVSKLMYTEIKNELAKSFDIIELDENPMLDKPVSAHPDMQLLRLDDEIVISKSLYAQNNKLADIINQKYNVNFTTSEHTARYPGDVIINALRLDLYLFCKTYAVDKSVVKLAEKKNITLVNVKQGYSACSTLALDKAIISADKGICEAARDKGYDVLQISPGNISLEGYDYGFIGGASFYDKENSRVYFFGNIKSHPDCEMIAAFIKKHSAQIFSFDHLPLYDFGGAVIL
ncbi:MAG: hypothetical protein IJD67_03760 [Clostridia bacterium]|nr:hypothetical protein [Clostridia bacterium]